MAKDSKTQDKDATRPASVPGTAGVPAPIPPKGSTAVEVPGGYDVGDLGAGFEGTGASDYLLPFVRPLQKMSPECDPDKAEFIEGAKAGTFLNTATKQLFDGKAGIKFIPVHRTHQYLEFIPRDQGGGFVAQYEPTDPAVHAAIDKAGQKFGKIPFGDGNELIETFNVFGLLVNDDGVASGVVIPFASTQIGTYKEMMTKLDTVRVVVPGRGRVPLPMFASRLRITTKFKENKKGTWHLMQIGWDGANAEECRLAPSDPLFLQAKAFREMVISGRARPEEPGGGGVAQEAHASAEDGGAF